MYAARLRSLSQEGDIEANLMTKPVLQYSGADGLL
jgi:hypothetical protein